MNFPLHQAAEQGDEARLNELVLFEDVNLSDFEEEALKPLHYAAAYGHKSCVEILLGAAADPNGRSKSGLTPLHEAVRNGREECVRLLVESNAKVSAYDENGWTPLHYAVLHEYPRIAAYLISKGAETNIITEQQETPLHLAMIVGNPETIATLLDRGARLTTRDASGLIPTARFPCAALSPVSIPDSSVRTADLARDLKCLVNSKAYSDITFHVTDSQETISAHRALIEIRCPGLLGFLMQQQQHQSSDRDMRTPFSFGLLQALLEWIYTGNVDKFTPLPGAPAPAPAAGAAATDLRLAFQLLDVAGRHRLAGLLRYCESVVINFADKMTVHTRGASEFWQSVALVAARPADYMAPEFIKHCALLVIRNFQTLLTLDIPSNLRENEISNIFRSAETDRKPDRFPEWVLAKMASRDNIKGGGATLLEGKNLRNCQTLVRRLLKDQKCALWLGAPVDPVALNIPDYPHVVKHPMDLGTINKRLTSKPPFYRTWQQVVADVRLVFSNCILFNGEWCELGQMTKRWANEFELSLASCVWEPAKKISQSALKQSMSDMAGHAGLASSRLLPGALTAPPSGGTGLKLRINLASSTSSLMSPAQPTPLQPPPPHPFSPQPAAHPFSPAQPTPQQPAPPQFSPIQQQPAASLYSPLPAAPAGSNNAAGAWLPPHDNNRMSPSVSMDFSSDQREEISNLVSQLPSEQLVRVLQIVAESRDLGPVKSEGKEQEQEGEVIDVDFGYMDNATLRRVEQFARQSLAAAAARVAQATAPVDNNEAYTPMSS